MVKEDILIAIKNATERGESLQKASATLISAGYSPEDVDEASKAADMGIISAIPKDESQEKTQIKPLPKLEDKIASLTSDATKSKKKIPGTITILLIALGILAGIFVIFLLFGEKILSSLFGSA